MNAHEDHIAYDREEKFEKGTEMSQRQHLLTRRAMLKLAGTVGVAAIGGAAGGLSLESVMT